ncbi:helicase-associated domain-containing protein [Chengkuizengella sp. SCS-71B]|uniref:helicase-associated domain-containing protein n=1 Tax=Chengkuizengella sp. SCS-71B TaxID=3115290 RepID=UPI0032C24AB5
MNCEKYLTQLPPSYLREIQTQSAYENLIKHGYELKDCLTSPQLLEKCYEKLNYIERHTLSWLIKNVGYEPFEWKHIISLMEDQLSKAELKVGLTLLRQKGIVFTFRKTWGEQIYVIPKDAFHSWVNVLLPQIKKVNCFSDEEVESQDRIGRGLIFDLFHLIIYIGKNEVLLTQNRMIKKRQLQKMCNLIDINEEDLQYIDLKYIGQDVYPKTFVLVYDLLLRLQLVEQKSKHVELNRDKVHGWLLQNSQQMNKTLYEVWHQICMPDQVWLQLIWAKMETIPYDVWYPIQELVNWVEHSELMLCYDLENKNCFNQLLNWMKVFVGFGWIQLGKTDNNEMVFRWKINLNSTDESLNLDEIEFYIQADFEIIVPPNVPFHILWELESMSEMVYSDTIMRYALTKKTIKNAVQNGRSTADIFQFLNKHSKYGLPDNVKKSVEDWSEHVGKIVFQEVLLLRCADESTVKQLSANPLFQPYIMTKIGDRNFIIQKSKLKELMKKLEDNGYSPLFSAQQGIEKEKVQFPYFNKTSNDSYILEDSKGTNGLVNSNKTMIYYEMEQNFPNVKDIYPSLDEIPAIWLKQYRAYHPSTEKEIIQKAIESHVYLKIRKNKVERIVLPQKLEEKEGKLFIHAFEKNIKITLFSHDWEEMRLIFPGINDK